MCDCYEILSSIKWIEMAIYVTVAGLLKQDINCPLENFKNNQPKTALTDILRKSIKITL